MEFSYSLVLHASPIKISSCCAGPLACLKYLSHPCMGVVYHPTQEAGGVELSYSFLVASHFSNQDKLLLCRPFNLF